MSAGLRLLPPPIRLTDVPEPRWDHVFRLSDDTGLLEHARNAIVRREHGYCVDDVARGLLAAVREPRPEPELIRHAERYLAFLTHAQGAAGGFRNRMSYDRRWQDEPSHGDWWGRALWGLGAAAARGQTRWLRREAMNAFRQGVRNRSPWPRAMAFAALGAAEVLRAEPRDREAAQLLGDAATVIGVPGSDPDWVWPEPELTYANPALAEVIIAAGDLLGDEGLLTDGLRMLAWLCEAQEHRGRLSAVPVCGWRHRARRNRIGDADPGVAPDLLDQQPVEVAATADACATAAAVTGDERWDGPLFQSIAWFLGDNDTGTVMWDSETYGCYDGLTVDGPNLNQGAESTLALVSTLQHARNLASRSATRPSGGLA
ncbi:glycosyl transferase [Actinoplanes sp. OR16]|uniref:glycosyltransferase n=1 Tax=Actinoplanes sp. OR16 TaxID=946334 RepID=UPI000F6EA515|nr:glycosyltransferase [Actinoplanes sp. OR16]BBH63941.1 glycosyl transferase [Actinoplanes sp. OR16]